MPLKPYTQRLNAFSRPTTWQVDQAGIYWNNDRGEQGEIPWSKLRRVRLRFEPSRFETRRIALHFDAPYPFKISNIDYRGFGDFKAHSTEFRAFVDAFHRHVPRNAGIQFRVGSTWGAYVMNIVITLAVVLLLLALAPIISVTGMPGGIVLARLVIILIFLPVVFKLLWLNRPRDYDPDQLPEAMLNQ